MESELRKKFVIVTVALLTLVLTAFYMATHFYYIYWFDRDTLSVVDWIAESEFLRLKESESDITYSEGIGEQAVIIEAIVTKDGKVVSAKHLDSSGDAGLNPEIIEKIINSGNEEYEAGDYIYASRELDDNRLLIIAANTESREKPMRLITRFALISLGLVLMTLITFFLSRFVTKPAAAAMVREKQFISDASHELKTPLGAISINAQALSSKLSDNDENIRKYVGNILRESDRMNRLIERLLMLSKIEEAKSNKKERISLSDCIEEMTLTYESVAYENGLKYEYDIENGLYIDGVKDEIDQLAAILIDNAIKHTGDQGSINVSLKKCSGKAILSVENTGTGISKNDLPHLFERFYTNDVSRSSGSFGLGLAIAKAITDNHGAEISVESELYKYTKFEVIFCI